ncbi:MAG: dTDP-4-dehydrorhamnose reductase [Candidatus Magasanikbacteria bacterium]
MKILITGSKGMLGNYLQKVLASEHEVLAFDKEDLDITDRIKSFEVIKNLQPDIIINAAAYNAVDKIEESESDYKIAQKINTEAPKILAEIAKELNIILVQYSTDYIFSGENKNGYDEDSVAEPISKYGETKLAGEENVRKNCDKYFIIRTSRIFGLPGSGEGSKKSFVDTMLWLVNEVGKKKLDVVDEEVSAPTYAFDLAVSTKEILESKQNFGTYHIINDGACTWYEFASEIFKLSNKKIILNKVMSNAFPRPAKRPAFSVLNNNKFKKLHSWQEALGDYLKNSK